MTERTKAKETSPKSQHIIQLPNALPISPSQNQVEKPSLSLPEENPKPPTHLSVQEPVAEEEL